MSTSVLEHGINSVNDQGGWRKVALICGIAAFVSALCSLVTMVVGFTLGGEPQTVGEYFELLNNNRIVGLLRMDFASVVNLMFYYLVFFGLFALLKQRHKALATFALVFAFTGISLWLVKHSGFSLIFLADQYKVAATETEKIQLVAAAKAVLSQDMWHSTAAIIGSLFGESAAFVFSLLLAKGNRFEKVIGWIGIIAHGLEFGHIIFGIVAPTVGLYLMVVAGPLYLLWLPLIGIRLLKFRH